MNSPIDPTSTGKLAQSAPERPTDQSGAKTALIVEDEIMIADYLGEILEGLGFQVISAQTYADAVNVLMGRQPDIAFIDLGLPDFSGLELIARLQKDFPVTKIVISTGYPQTVKNDLSADAVAVPLLAKPYTFNAVINIVKDCGF